MEALAKVIADITEFLVGGVLFLGSVALLGHAVFPDEFGTLLDHQIPSTAGGVLTIVALALIYAFGVIAEGLSRMLLEWRLTYLTVHRWDFVSDASSFSQKVEEGGDNQFAFHDAGETRKLRIYTREEWRTAATSYNESLGNTIEAQLKRLRIERTFFLSSLVSLLALFIEGNWGLAAATAVLCATGALLVDERFNRFLAAIVRAHNIMNEGLPTFDSGVPTGMSA